ncbi:hypothetical protein R1sor_001470 [Riccia sorocarpa]|uniref:Uncharacterized protein n=1 Tax=Riccia sorocarpa TaxID=122646 RepID=A0ABD3GW34_9MARC
MVGGQHVDFSLEAIRDAFHLPVGRDMCRRLKQQQHFADWFDFYDIKRKAFWANLCLKPGWALAFKLINALLLGRRFAKEIRGVLAWYVKSKVDPEGNPEHDDLDWAKAAAAAAPTAAVPAGAVPAGEGQSESESRDGQSREGEDESSAAETDDNEEENSIPGDNEVLLGHSDGDLSPSRTRPIRVHEEAGPSSTKRRRRYLYLFRGCGNVVNQLSHYSLNERSKKRASFSAREPSRHSTGLPMEVDGMAEITNDPGSEFMIVPHRPGASLQSWGQPMEEVRPENTSNIEVRLQISSTREPGMQSLGQPMEEEVWPQNTSNLEIRLQISPPREPGMSVQNVPIQSVEMERLDEEPETSVARQTSGHSNRTVDTTPSPGKSSRSASTGKSSGSPSRTSQGECSPSE